jgi:hypothetical protein
MKTESQVNLAFTDKLSETEYRTYIVYCGHNWGRGKTLQPAIKSARVHPANMFTACLFKSNEPIEAWVTESGNYRYETETDKAKVEVIELGNVQNWFTVDDEIDQLFRSLCTAVREKDGQLGVKFEDSVYLMLEKYIND